MPINSQKGLSANQAGFAQVVVLLSIFTIVLIIFLFIASQLKISRVYDSATGAVKGVLLAKGGEDGDDSNSGSGSRGSLTDSLKTAEPAKTPEPKDEDEEDEDEEDEDEDNEDEDSPPAGIQNIFRGSLLRSIKPTSSPNIKIQKEGNKSESEFESADGVKIKTKVEDDGRSRIDIYSGGIKLRYEIRDGRVIIKAETEDGEEIEGEEIFKIVDRLDKDDIKVSTAGGKLSITRGNFGALSNFPLSINLATNQLIASTSAGVKILTILPDQAVQNMLAANVISQLPATQSASLASVQDAITLGELNGIPVYTIKGVKNQNLLGFIPVQTPVTAVVSAQTGNLVSEELSLLSQIIDLLSP